MRFGLGDCRGFGSGSGYGVGALIGFSCGILGDSGVGEDCLMTVGDPSGVGACDGTLDLGDGCGGDCKTWDTGVCVESAGTGRRVTCCLGSGDRG